MHIKNLSLLPFLLSAAVAQVAPAPLGETQGQGKAVATGAAVAASSSSGGLYGPLADNTVPLPAAFASTFGNANNNIPFSWTPNLYQQVFDGSELPASFVMTGIGLRQDDGFSGFPGKTVDLEMNIGLTTLSAATLGTTFATNFDSGPPVNVLVRTNVNLPNIPPAPITDPGIFFWHLPFTTPFPWPASGGGKNLLLEVNNRGNNNGNAIFTYPLDATSGPGVTTTRLYGTATTGTLTRNYGLIISFDGAGTAAWYTYYGSGCAGTSGPPGVIVPTGASGTFANGNNNIPFSWTPIQYQQVFLGSEITRPQIMNALGLRQDEQFSALPGNSVDLEINLGNTTKNVTSLTNTFAANFDLAPPINVLPRGNVNLPAIPPTLPTDPLVFFATIPFTTPFVWAPAGNNLLIEVINRGNGNGNAIFTYPLDAGSGINTTRLYGTSTTGTLGAGYGLVMYFRGAGNGSLVPLLAATGRGLLGTSVQVSVARAKPASIAILLTGSSMTTWGAIPLPLDLTSTGAPGCFLLASGNLFIAAAATDAAGNASITVAVPNDASLVGAHAFEQYAVVDATTNALGLAFTRGGDLLIGNF